MTRNSISTQAELWQHACEVAREHGYNAHAVYDLMLFGEDDDTVLEVLKVAAQSYGLVDAHVLMRVVTHERTSKWLRDQAT